MAAPTKKSSRILGIVIPEDTEFEEPAAPTGTLVWRRVQEFKTVSNKYAENEMEMIRNRMATRQSAFQRRVQYEATRIRQAIEASKKE